LRRRAERMARPARVRIRKRKPCVFARRRLFGWNVRLLTRGSPTKVMNEWRPQFRHSHAARSCDPAYAGALATVRSPAKPVKRTAGQFALDEPIGNALWAVRSSRHAEARGRIVGNRLKRARKVR